MVFGNIVSEYDLPCWRSEYMHIWVTDSSQQKVFHCNRTVPSQWATVGMSLPLGFKFPQSFCVAYLSEIVESFGNLLKLILAAVINEPFTQFVSPKPQEWPAAAGRATAVAALIPIAVPLAATPTPPNPVAVAAAVPPTAAPAAAAPTPAKLVPFFMSSILAPASICNPKELGCVDISFQPYESADKV